MSYCHNHAKPYCRTKIIINFLEESFKMCRFVREISPFNYKVISLLVFSVYIPFLISRVRPVHSIFEKKSILENTSQIFTYLASSFNLCNVLRYSRTATRARPAIAQIIAPGIWRSRTFIGLPELMMRSAAVEAAS